MGANGTYFGSLCVDRYMTAVSAFPYLDFALFENSSGPNIFEKCAVSFLMVLFYCRYSTEFCRKLGKSLGFGSLGKALLHIRQFEVFAVVGGTEIFGGTADACKLLEPHFCMLFFIVRGF